MKLSTSQREAIRATAEGKRFGARNTEQSLIRLGLATAKPGRGAGISSAWIELTAAGRKAHSEIMESGDGPEALKEMFRF